VKACFSKKSPFLKFVINRSSLGRDLDEMEHWQSFFLAPLFDTTVFEMSLR